MIANAFAAAASATSEPVAIARELAPIFARRAAENQDEDRFVAENFAMLRDAGLVEAGVPLELGGGGADVAARRASSRRASRGERRSP
jgi:alkylation response protein AidB-like acyl-CoA dehydrogenase